MEESDKEFLFSLGSKYTIEAAFVFSATCYIEFKLAQ